MAELSSLHTKHTGDNSDFKKSMWESIALVDQFGDKIVAQTAKETREYNARGAAAQKVIAQSRASYNDRLRLSGRMTVAFKAEKLGIDKLVSSGNALQGAMATGTARVNNFNGEVRVSRFHTANLAAQFNDIGVMLAAGQSPLLLAVQQGTQISQVFGAMGGGPMDNLRAMGQGLRQIISPMSLITIGTIAAGAALVQWGVSAFKAHEGGSEFSKILAEINTELETAETRIEAYNRGLSEASSNALYERLAELTEEIGEQQAFLNRQMEVYGDSVNAPLDGHKEILASLKLERDELLATIRANETKGDRVEEARKAYENSVTQVELLKTGVQAASGGVLTLADHAQTLADRLGDAKDNILETVRGMGIAALAADQSQLGRGSMGPGGPTSAASRFEASTGMFITSDKPKGQGRGSRGSSANPNAGIDRQVAALATSIMTPAEKEAEQFAERQKVLEEALEKRRITEAEHGNLLVGIQKQHADKMAQIEHTAQMAKLSGWAGAFGDLASLASSENDRLAKIGLMAAKIQVGIEGIQSASSAWQKGMAIGGPPVAAAFAGASILKTASLMSQLNSGSPNAAAGGATGGGGAGAVGGTAGGGAGASGGAPRPIVQLALYGDQGFSRAQIVQLTEAINEGIDEGQQPIQIRGRR